MNGEIGLKHQIDQKIYHPHPILFIKTNLLVGPTGLELQTLPQKIKNLNPLKQQDHLLEI